MINLPDNPFSSPRTTATASHDSTKSEPRRREYWRIFAIASVVVGLIPIYGHIAHVARDSQLTVLFLMLAWAVNCCNVAVCIVRGLLIRGSAEATFWMLLSGLLIVFAYFGFYGIGHAILELWA